MNLRSLFANTNHVQVFQTGSTIFAEGTPGEVMYVVLEGEVVQMMTQDGGKTAQLQGDHEGCRSFTTKFGGMWTLLLTAFE